MSERLHEYKFPVPYLAESTIESSAEQLIRDYGQKFGPVLGPPVPVDEIVDSHIGLDLRIEDLIAQYDDTKLLGATWVDAREVAIDATLDPHNFPKMLGRYRFTVGHEIGHWVLHAPLIRAAAAQGDLFSKDKPKVIVCRAPGPQKPREEWQADMFSGYLLMPRRMILSAWQSLYGDLPYRIVDDRVDLSARWSLDDRRLLASGEVREMASVFEVSLQAMQIRLAGLRLLRNRSSQQALF